MDDLLIESFIYLFMFFGCWKCSSYNNTESCTSKYRAGVIQYLSFIYGACVHFVNFSGKLVLKLLGCLVMLPGLQFFKYLTYNLQNDYGIQ